METAVSQECVCGCFYFDPTYEAWKQRMIAALRRGNYSISILPTRHGNTFKTASLAVIPWISILPTRHGNGNCTLIIEEADLYSDPTYEAWKHAKWKPKRNNALYSDPTYEAWKHKTVWALRLKIEGIPILPMRHGNQVEEFLSYLIAPCQPPQRTSCVGKVLKIEACHWLLHGVSNRSAWSSEMDIC